MTQEEKEKLLIEFLVTADDACKKSMGDGMINYAYLSGLYRSVISIIILSDNPIEAFKNEIRYLRD